MQHLRISPSLSARDVVTIVLRRRWTILIVQACILLVVGTYAFYWPPTYEATVRFLVKNDRVEPVITADQQSIRTLTRTGVSEVDLNAEVALMLSAAVLEKTVGDLRLDEIPEHWAVRLLSWPLRRATAAYNAYHGRPDETAGQRAAGQLARRLSVEAETKSAIVLLRLRWGHPRAAEEILERLAQNYVAQHLAVRRTADSQTFFREQTTRKRAELDAIAARIAAVRPAGSLALVTAERDVAARQASDFEGQWRKTRANRAEVRARIAELEAQLVALPDRLTLEDRTIVSAQTLDTLKSRVLDLRLQRTQLVQKYAPTHRLVRQIDELLSQGEAMLQREEQGAYSEVTTGRNAAADTVRQDLLMSRVQLQALEALDAGMRKEQAALVNAVATYDAQIEQLRVLDIERSASEGAYLQYLTQYEEAQASDTLSRAPFANTVAIEPVRAGASPVKPNRGLLLKLALVVGLLVSLGTGVLAEVLDHRVHRPRDIERAADVPVLAVFDTYPPTSEWSGERGV